MKQLLKEMKQMTEQELNSLIFSNIIYFYMLFPSSIISKEDY